MSHNHAALHRKIRALRRTRDQLEPMVHPSPADAQELWEQLEKRWRDLDDQAKHLTRGTKDALDGVADMVTELRKGYYRLASALREPRSESLWGQVRNSLDRLVQGGHRTSDCVAGSVEDLHAREDRRGVGIVDVGKEQGELARSKDLLELLRGEVIGVSRDDQPVEGVGPARPGARSARSARAAGRRER